MSGEYRAGAGLRSSSTDGVPASADACEDCEPYGGDGLRSLRFLPHDRNGTLERLNDRVMRIVSHDAWRMRIRDAG